MCEHEMDSNIPLSPPADLSKRWMYPGDAEDMARFNAACFRIWCKYCGMPGWCVDDTGNIFDDE